MKLFHNPTFSTLTLLLAFIFSSLAKDSFDEAPETVTQTILAFSVPILSPSPPPHSPEDNDEDRDDGIGQKQKSRAMQTLTITETSSTPDIQATRPVIVPTASGVIGSIDLPNAGVSCQSFISDSVFQSSVLNSTNTIRRTHNASAVAWNETLVAAAKERVETCLGKKRLNGDFGEITAHNYLDVTSSIDSWALHALSFNLSDLNTQSQNIKSLKSILKFTQLVWKSSTQIGCARQNCAEKTDYPKWLLICEMSPKGNIPKKFAENVQGPVEGDKSGMLGAQKIPKGKPNDGTIGKHKGKSNNGSGRLDRLQVWCVFIVVWLVLGAVFV